MGWQCHRLCEAVTLRGLDNCAKYGYEWPHYYYDKCGTHAKQSYVLTWNMVMYCKELELMANEEAALFDEF